MFPLSKLLTGLIRIGTLEVIDAEGSSQKFHGNELEPSATMKLSDPKLYRSLFLNPELAAGEAYMDGTMTFPESSFETFSSSSHSTATVRPVRPALSIRRAARFHAR